MTSILSAADPDAIAHAAAVLRGGGLVAFPTETVYGLGANALDPVAVGRIFAAKGRPTFNPIIVHVADTAAARSLAMQWPASAERLAAALWPGPLTLVVPKRATVPDNVTAGRSAVGLRVPSHPVALALLRAAGVPIAAPSANRSMATSPTTAEHVVSGLGDRVDLVLDAGPSRAGIESTVVDLTTDPATLLRPGPISREMLKRYVGGVADRCTADGDHPRSSPGQLPRHYAPTARLRIVATAHDLEAAITSPATRRPIGAMLRLLPDCAADHVVRLPEDPAGYARGLYAAFHAMDALGCAELVVEAVPATPAWEGVRDRLERAAH